MKIIFKPVRKIVLLFVSSLMILFIQSCGGNTEEPVEQIKSNLKDASSYSIILEDMKEEGTFSSTYFHKYRVIQDTKGWASDWLEVSENYYQTNENFLGMCLASKKEGEINNTAVPPGYAYVGDKKYGKWSTDSSGNSFWEYYGKYAMFSTLMGGFYRPVYRNDYNGYRSYRKSYRNKPYYGRKNQYGTKGRIAKKAKPNFYKRKMAKVSRKSSSFKSRVSKRIGRTRSSTRSRSGGFGK